MFKQKTLKLMIRESEIRNYLLILNLRILETIF